MEIERNAILWESYGLIVTGSLRYGPVKVIGTFWGPSIKESWGVRSKTVYRYSECPVSDSSPDAMPEAIQWKPTSRITAF